MSFARRLVNSLTACHEVRGEMCGQPRTSPVHASDDPDINDPEIIRRGEAIGIVSDWESANDLDLSVPHKYDLADRILEIMPTHAEAAPEDYHPLAIFDAGFGDSAEAAPVDFSKLTEEQWAGAIQSRNRQIFGEPESAPRKRRQRPTMTANYQERLERDAEATDFLNAEADAYLRAACTENECRLCRLPQHARKPGMKHAGLKAAAPVAEPPVKCGDCGEMELHDPSCTYKGIVRQEQTVFCDAAPESAGCGRIPVTALYWIKNAKEIRSPKGNTIDMTRSRLRTLMMWQMMPHMLLGHPTAAILSLLGLRGPCEWLHWRTLPKRGRAKISQSQIDYVHERSIFWVETFFGPITHLLGALNLHYIGYKFYMLGPVEDAIKYSACSGLFIRWGTYSSSAKEREEVKNLLNSVRLQRAVLSSSGHLRWPHITTKPDRQWLDGYKGQGHV